jgi:hypothetical protein
MLASLRLSRAVAAELDGRHAAGLLPSIRLGPSSISHRTTFPASPLPRFPASYGPDSAGRAPRFELEYPRVQLPPLPVPCAPAPGVFKYD